MTLKLSEGLLRETFTRLRACGACDRECVCYWSGPIDTPAVVDAVLHPRHTGHWGFYEVDGTWLNETWIELANSRRTIRVQIHTHAGNAFHSWLDDAFPIVQTPGLLSLVIPRFAHGPASFEDAYLARLVGQDEWESVDPKVELELSR